MNIPRITINVESGCTTCHKSLIIPVTSGGCGCNNPIHVDTSPNSPCVDCTTTCDDVDETDCMIWSGADIPALGIKNGDKLTKVVIILAAQVIALKQRVSILEEDAGGSV